MLPAPTFDTILRRAKRYSGDDPTGQRLVSIVFANPTSPVWRDLHTNRAFLDAQSGYQWDLFFAGMSGHEKMDDNAVQIWDPFWRDNWKRYFNPQQFRNIVDAVEAGEWAALSSTNSDKKAWRYSGATDLISFMVYEGDPDWLTLRSLQLERSGDELGSGHTLGELTERLRRWETGDADRSLAPGEVRKSETDASLLSASLSWSANAIVGGTLGNAAYDFLKQIFS